MEAAAVQGRVFGHISEWGGGVVGGLDEVPLTTPPSLYKLTPPIPRCGLCLFQGFFAGFKLSGSVGGGAKLFSRSLHVLVFIFCNMTVPQQ